MTEYTDEELAQILDKDIFHLISETADELGMECYVVGGYVRDIFLDAPSDDIDCVVVGNQFTVHSAQFTVDDSVKPGIAVAKLLKKKLGRRATLSVFKNFGTAQVKVSSQCIVLGRAKRRPTAVRLHSAQLGQSEQSIEVEFVGARRESYQRDSRKPIVEDGTLEDDQNRRDFTINAMAICLNKARFGELVDPFGGLDDLWDGIIRTPLDPDITFSDDPLRMLRCIRFATRLNFQIEDETFEALERNAERIRIISAERINEELNKILMTKTPSRGFVDLQRCGLLQIIMPELAVMDMVEARNGKAHKNNFYHTLEVLDNVAKANGDLWLRWAALLHDIGKPKSKRWDNQQGWTFHSHNYIGAKMVPGIFRKLKLPMDQKMKYVQKLVELHMRPIAIADNEVTDSAVRRLVNDAGDDIDDLMVLCEADITSKNQVRKQRFRDNYTLVREKIEDLKERDYKRLLQPVIDGNEIMQLFNLKPCREVGELKQYLKDAVLDGTTPNEREPLMLLLKEKAREMGI
ncbi:MAG: HD domain-containing protein [Prevotella sp.]|nr:HD domain-containing protein [Prevotella sp.]